jgi:RNA polymerase sigma-70 factor, ECF subfamily
MRETTSRGEAFEVLVNKYQGRLFSYALHLLRNREDAEETVQDALMKAYHAWPRFKARRHTSLSAWLLRITLNVARNRLRRKRVAQINIGRWSDSWHGAPEERATAATLLEDQITIDLVKRAIHDLPQHLVEAARLQLVEELTLSEIARRCSQPLGTVKSHVFRAKQYLRRLLKPTLGAAV